MGSSVRGLRSERLPPNSGARLRSQAVSFVANPLAASMWLIFMPSCNKEPPADEHRRSELTSQSAPAVVTSASTSEAPTVSVNLNGETRVHAGASGDTGPRIYAKSPQTWIFAEPRQGAGKLGYLRTGGSAPVNPQPILNPSCPRGWYSLVPRGFVCLDSASTTDANDPIVVAMHDWGPVFDRKLPYIYGTVRRPGPVYRRLPSEEELNAAEPELSAQIERWLAASGEAGAGFAQRVWSPTTETIPDPKAAWLDKQSDPIPEFLRTGKFAPRVPAETAPTDNSPVLGIMARRVGYSLLKTLLFNGRRYGVSAKFEVVPTEHLRPIQGSDFHGFRIPEDIDFPFAIVRQPGAMLFSYDSASKKTSPQGRAPYRGALKLSGKQAFFRGKLFYETVDGLWIGDRDASRLDPVRKMPAWGSNGEKWIDINVTKQTLALYEGTKAVYATLVLTGEAGLSDPEKSTATKRGIYRIHTKHVSVMMDSDEVGEEFELRDVPYVQYFESNYALHGAYWHDRFGIPKSHGCINLAPEDARRIFFWTEPTVPVGWHGALLPLKGTVLFVHP